jgi:hypothetical protein
MGGEFCLGSTSRRRVWATSRLSSFPRDPEVSTPTNKNKIHQAFVSDLPIKTWNEYLNDGRVKLGTTTLKEPGLSFQQAHLQALIRSGELLPLLMEREERFRLCQLRRTGRWAIGLSTCCMTPDRCS